MRKELSISHTEQSCATPQIDDAAFTQTLLPANLFLYQREVAKSSFVSELAQGHGVAGQVPERVQGWGGLMPWPSEAGSIEEHKGIQWRECPFVSEQHARLALMRRLFVVGLSTSSGLVDSLT